MDAAIAYQRRLIETATPIGLIVLLFERAVLLLERSVAAMKRNDIEARTANLNRVLAIVAELKSSLNFERGGAAAKQFDLFYQVAERQIVTAGVRRDVKLLEEVHNQFVLVRDAWRKVEGRPETVSSTHDNFEDTSGEVRTSWRA